MTLIDLLGVFSMGEVNVCAKVRVQLVNEAAPLGTVAILPLCFTQR